MTAAKTECPVWYLERAIPRLVEIDRLTPRCAWEKHEFLATEAERVARRAWERLMREQCEDEVAAGL